ncbi:MAG: photosystem II reaction center PsbP family protein [Treponema sp.]|nr:photosystem II reaction center PsbP family protein [Treponema sp.]
MKKLFVIFAVLFVFAAQVFGQNKKVVSDGTISGSIPSDWESYSIDDDVLFYIFAPEVDGDFFRENVTITCEEIGKGIKLADLMKLLPDTFAEVYDSFEIVEKGKDYFIFDGIIQDVHVVQYLKLIIKKENLYTICASADPDDFDSYYESFKEILNSFKVK